MDKVNRIIFVCKAGTLRAPMAAAIFAQIPLNFQVDIMSRGLIVLMPEPLNQKVEAILISNNLALDNYSSRQLEAEDIIEGTIIITFSSKLRDKIAQTFEYEEVYVLTELVGNELEILDPYGESVQMYGLCFETMQNSLKDLAIRLNSSNGRLVNE